MDILDGTDTMDEINRLETEQCGSTSVQLVQLPTRSNIPDVSMVRNIGTVEQRIGTEQCGSTSVQLVQLPTYSDTPDVSMVSNTGAVEQTRESERCSSTSIQLVQLPTHYNISGVSMVVNTGDSEDQYRPMTPGEEEIMRIYEDGIYRAPDLIERTGGLWITGRISPLLESAVFAPVDMIDSDPELDELLRDSLDILESSITPSFPIFQETIAQLRTSTSTTRIVADTLQRTWRTCYPG